MSDEKKQKQYVYDGSDGSSITLEGFAFEAGVPKPVPPNIEVLIGRMHSKTITVVVDKKEKKAAEAAGVTNV